MCKKEGGGKDLWGKSGEEWRRKGGGEELEEVEVRIFVMVKSMILIVSLFYP